MTNIDALAALVGRIDLNPGLPNVGRLWVGRESLEPLAAHETAARRDKYAVVALVQEVAGCASARFHRGKIVGFGTPRRAEIMRRVHTPVQAFMPSPLHPEGAVLAAKVAKANAAHIDIAAATQVTGRATVVVATDAVRPVLFTSDPGGAVDAPSEYWEEVSDPAAFIAAVQARGNAAL